MATTVTMSTQLNTTQSTQRVIGTITLSGSYTTGGDTLNLAQFPVQSQQSPLYIDFSEITATPCGASFAYVPGTTLANGKLFISTAVNTQLAAGAYATGYTGTTIYFEAVFPLGR